MLYCCIAPSPLHDGRPCGCHVESWPRLPVPVCVQRESSSNGPRGGGGAEAAAARAVVSCTTGLRAHGALGGAHATASLCMCSMLYAPDARSYSSRLPACSSSTRPLLPAPQAGPPPSRSSRRLGKWKVGLSGKRRMSVQCLHHMPACLCRDLPSYAGMHLQLPCRKPIQVKRCCLLHL